MTLTVTSDIRNQDLPIPHINAMIKAAMLSVPFTPGSARKSSLLLLVRVSGRDWDIYMVVRGEIFAHYAGAYARE